MYDVVALGELLIDFTPAGKSQAGNILFERNPGGAPANVLAALSKLGGSGAFIGKVGNDQFGLYLKGVLEETGIGTKGLKFSDEVNTTLAFVHLDHSGDRSFSFYRKPGADIMLTPDDLSFDLIDESAIFHFGSLSMTDEPARAATFKALDYARNKGKIISYDPNWRPALWKSDDAAKRGMEYGLRFTDILKLSEVELEFLTGKSDLEEGTKPLLDMGITIVLVTLGPKGCFYRCRTGAGYVTTYDTKIVDTTGAGDSFLGCMLYQLSKSGKKPDQIEPLELAAMVDHSNAAGALCASRKGAIPAMPAMEEILHCMKHVRRLQLG